MPQARKQTTRRPAEQEKYRAELTSSQLVIGICILMLFGLACFLVGVLVGKFDAAPVSEQIASVSPPVETRTVRLAPPEPAPEPEPEPAPTQPVPEPPAERQPEPAPVADSEPRVITLPDAEPTDQTSPDPEPVDMPDTTTPAPPQAPEVTAPPEPQPDPAPQSTTPEIGETPQPAASGGQEARVDVLEPELESVSQSSPQPPSTTERKPGQFTVQIGAFSEQANAELAKKRIEDSTAYPVFLVDNPSGSLVRVHVGVFGSEGEAESAQTELGEKLGYNESIITKHSIALTQAPSN